MDPTTLVTFLFQAPHEVRHVELLGSWDNFSQPYRMHHDRRRGLGFWSGCFKFDNIVFDGDRPQWTKPRSGGLKQGGVYWYYYRLDCDVEAYDDGLPCTTNCPLMPGQMLNVIEVPIELVEPVSRCRSASADIAGTLANLPMTHTLDPRDKFAAPEPPPVSKVHGRCISDMALGGRLEGAQPPSTARSVESPLSSPSSEDGHAEALERPWKRIRSRGNSSYRSSCSSHSHTKSAHLSIIDAYALGPDPDEPAQPIEDAALVSLPQADVCGRFDFEAAEENKDPDPVNNAYAEDDEDAEDDEVASLGPSSVRNIQFYGSPDTHDEWRPRLHAIDNFPLRAHAPLETGPPLHTLTATNHIPAPDQSALDICSPTFSAATVSSNDGLNTPFRLSAGYSRSTTSEDHALEDVTKRLQALDTRSRSLSPRARGLEQPQPTFAAYALPEPMALQHAPSLSKVAAPEGPFSQGLVLPAFLQETTSSMADDIFSELGYLSGSIA